ncbi:MAG TPA: hypothetical protein PLX84_14855 [Acidiphilium sp.]|nr:hypothetical protein [Acidiphilium sp.]
MMLIINQYMMSIMNNPMERVRWFSDRPSRLPAPRTASAYAERLTRRGHDPVLVARNETRLTEVAARFREETGVRIEMLPAGLIDDDDLARAEAGRRADARRAMLLQLSTR